MSTWLYQLNPKDWPPEVFRYEIRENQRWRWRCGRIQSKEEPATGDTLLFFYALKGGKDPGFYGWAVVERFDKDNRLLYFIPAPPTDHLKIDPWGNAEAMAIAVEIRGKMKQATLFPVSRKLLPGIRLGIKRWFNRR